MGLKLKDKQQSYEVKSIRRDLKVLNKQTNLTQEKETYNIKKVGPKQETFSNTLGKKSQKFKMQKQTSRQIPSFHMTTYKEYTTVKVTNCIPYTTV